MAFKLSNETKVGAFAAIAITILILGYNYLSGRDNLFGRDLTLYTNLDSLSGLTNSNTILLNGYRVGLVTGIEMDKTTKKLKVEMTINEDIKIPKDSKVSLYSTDLFGGKGLKLILGKNPKNCKEGDFIENGMEASLMEKMGEVLTPMQVKLKTILNSVDSLLKQPALVNSLNKLPGVLDGLRNTIDQTGKTIGDLQPKLSQTVDNINKAINDLMNGNSANINLIVSNLKKTSDQLSQMDLKAVVENMNKTVTSLQGILEKMNSGEGTLGQLATNKKLYEDLDQTIKNIGVLTADLQKHPQKYISIPTGTKKQKKAILESAADTSLHH